MARSQLRHNVVDRAGNVIQNALCYVYEYGTTDPVADIYAAPTGGPPLSSLITNDQGEAVAYLDTARLVDVRVTDSGGTAYYPTRPGEGLTWTPFTETVEVPGTATGGGQGQTPWLTDIDAAVHSLLDLGSLEFATIAYDYNVSPPVPTLIASEIDGSAGSFTDALKVDWNAYGTLRTESSNNADVGQTWVDEWGPYSAAGGISRKHYPSGQDPHTGTPDQTATLTAGFAGFLYDNSTTLDPGRVQFHATPDGIDVTIHAHSGGPSQSLGIMQLSQYGLGYQAIDSSGNAVGLGGDTGAGALGFIGEVLEFFVDGGNTLVDAVLLPSQAGTFYGVPGLTLTSTAAPHGDHPVMLTVGDGTDFGAGHVSSVANLAALDFSGIFDAQFQTAAGVYTEAYMQALDSAATMEMQHYQPGVYNQRLGTQVTAARGPEMYFKEGDGTVAIPSLYAKQSDPWNDRPGLALLGKAGALDDAALTVGTSGLPSSTAPYAVAALVAVSETGNTYANFDTYAESLTGSAKVTLSAHPDTDTVVTIENTLLAGAHARIDLKSLLDGTPLIDMEAGTSHMQLAVDAGGVGSVAALGGLVLQADAGAALGFYGAAPVLQHAAIPDVAPGATLDDLRTSFNALLGTIRDLGLVAA